MKRVLWVSFSFVKGGRRFVTTSNKVSFLETGMKLEISYSLLIANDPLMKKVFPLPVAHNDVSVRASLQGADGNANDECSYGVAESYVVVQ